MKEANTTEMSAEEQDELGHRILDETRRRRKLLETSKRYVPGWGDYFSLLLFSVLFAATVVKSEWFTNSAPFLSVALLLWAGFHIRGLNARMDALIKLLDLDEAAIMNHAVHEVKK